jgi:hypothetical protein
LRINHYRDPYAHGGEVIKPIASSRSVPARRRTAARAKQGRLRRIRADGLVEVESSRTYRSVVDLEEAATTTARDELNTERGHGKNELPEMRDAEAGERHRDAEGA